MFTFGLSFDINKRSEEFFSASLSLRMCKMSKFAARGSLIRVLLILKEHAQCKLGSRHGQQ